MEFDPKQHWEKAYKEKQLGQVSWYQANPNVSLELIVSSGITKTESIIDVGGGASVLVDKLLEKGFSDVSVLDISAKAIEYSKIRLGQDARKASWVETDITKFSPPKQYDLWHDRAVFHFLTDPLDRKKYIEVIEKAVKSDGHVVIATFGLDGPIKCSGLNIERFNSEKLKNELGESFYFIRSVEETHITPWQSEQKFIYCFFRRV